MKYDFNPIWSKILPKGGAEIAATKKGKLVSIPAI